MWSTAQINSVAKVVKMNIAFKKKEIVQKKNNNGNLKTSVVQTYFSFYDHINPLLILLSYRC